MAKEMSKPKIRAGIVILSIYLIIPFSWNLAFASNPANEKESAAKIKPEQSLENSIQGKSAAVTDEKSRTKVVFQVDVLSLNVPLSDVNGFLNKQFKIKDIPCVLTQTQVEQFKKWVVSIPGTTITSNLDASVYPWQSANLDATKQNKFITGYEKDPNSPSKYKPKQETYRTGVELKLSPGSISRKDEPVGVYIDFKKTDIAIVEEKLHSSGNPVQMPDFNISEISTKVSIPTGEYSLTAIGGKLSGIVTKSGSVRSGEQIILLVKLDVKVEDKPDALTAQEMQLAGIWRSSYIGYTDDNQEVTIFMILNNDRSWLVVSFIGKEEIPTKIYSTEGGPLWFCRENSLLEFFPPPPGGGDRLFNQNIVSVTHDTLSIGPGRAGYIHERKRVSGQAEVKIREMIAQQPQNTNK